MATVMRQFTGRTFYLAWTPDGEIAPILLHTYYNDFDAGIDADYKDNTAGGHDLESMQFIRDKVAPKASIGYYEPSAGTSVFAEFLQPGTFGILEWGYEGNASGKPRWGIQAEIKKSNVSAKKSDLLVADVEWVNIADDWEYNGRTATFPAE
jgi:hypothetical protein